MAWRTAPLAPAVWLLCLESLQEFVTHSDVYLNHSNRCQHYSALSRDTCHEADNNVNVRMSGRSLSAAICQQSSLDSNQNRSVHRIWIPVVTPDCRRPIYQIYIKPFVTTHCNNNIGPHPSCIIWKIRSMFKQ